MNAADRLIWKRENALANLRGYEAQMRRSGATDPGPLLGEAIGRQMRELADLDAELAVMRGMPPPIPWTVGDWRRRVATSVNGHHRP